MKTKSLVVIALLAFGCSLASAQSFGFESVGGGLYCNYEVLQNIAPYSVWQGEDVLSTCGAEVNATIVGITASLEARNNPLGFSLNPGVNYADNIYDAFALGYTGAQWDVSTALKCTSKHYGWIGFASVSGFIFGDTYGYLSCSIPGKGPTPTRGLSTGSAQVPARK